MQSEIPISTDNPDFIEKVELKLTQGEPVVVLLRYCHQGGNRGSFLRLIIFPVGRLRRPRPSAGNASR
jgi:hypothetical protein